jgi:hypothetical protein
VLKGEIHAFDRAVPALRNPADRSDCITLYWSRLLLRGTVEEKYR